MLKQNRKAMEIKPIRLDLPKAIYLEIKEIAEDEDKSRTYVIVEALQEFITRKGKTIWINLNKNYKRQLR